MNTLARLQKLESAVPDGATDERHFVQRIGAGGVTYWIDGAEVDAAEYLKHAPTGIPVVRILGFDDIPTE
jgi:hypothetical protein